MFRISENTVQKQIVQYCNFNIAKGVVWWSTPNERKPADNLNELMKMGIKDGVADMCFLRLDGYIATLNAEKPDFTATDARKYPALFFIEVKRPEIKGPSPKTGKEIILQRAGRQSDAQKQFEKDVNACGCEYHLVYSINQFIKIMQGKGVFR